MYHCIRYIKVDNVQGKNTQTDYPTPFNLTPVIYRKMNGKDGGVGHYKNLTEWTPLLHQHQF